MLAAQNVPLSLLGRARSWRDHTGVVEVIQRELSQHFPDSLHVTPVSTFPHEQ